MERYGLIGHPLGHSFSADFFNHRFASEGRAARYDLFPMEHLTDLHAFAEQHPELRGLNVTIPHRASSPNLMPFRRRPSASVRSTW